MRSGCVALWVVVLGLLGCQRQGGPGRGPLPPDGSAVLMATTVSDAGLGSADLSLRRADAGGLWTERRLDLGVSTLDGGGRAHLALAELDRPDAGADDGPAAQVLKQSAVGADFLVLELGADNAVKKLSAISGAQAQVLCEEESDHEAGKAHTECDSRLVLRSTAEADAEQLTVAYDVPGIRCSGEGAADCFQSADVESSWLMLPGLPGGLIVVGGWSSQDQAWERKSETPSAVYALFRRGSMAPLELRKVLQFLSVTHSEVTREDHPEMTRRDREREPTHSEENQRTELSVVKKGKRSLPELVATTTTEHLTQFEHKPDKRRTEHARTRYVFDGIRYVAADTALNTAEHCGSLTRHCAAQEDCCGGECKPLHTIQHCGACGHGCPGGPATWSEAACTDPQKGVCFFGCQGAHYDVDGKESNGCELTDTTPSLTDLGTQSCWDKPLVWKGVLLADQREHRSPQVESLDPKVGAVPKRMQVTASGGFLCQNDISLTVTTRDGGKEACYLLHVDGLKTPQKLTLRGVDEQTLSLPRGAYASGAGLRFRLDKTCPGASALQFSVAFHL